MKNIAVIGARGVVGQTMLKVLEEQKVKGNITQWSTQHVDGMIELTEENIIKHKPDFALFATDSSVSGEFAPIVVKHGGRVIDASSFFRTDPNIPIVIPEVNPEAIANNPIVSKPNCTTIQALVALKPLHDAFGIKTLIFSSYQAVSGAGVKGIEELETKGRIYNNLVPYIAGEEEKMVFETKKILKTEDIKISATCVRVPIVNGHSLAVTATFEKPITVESATKILEKAPGVILSELPMPKEIDGRDEVYVGRIRTDENGFHMFVVADNVRKGAATNAIQILKEMLK